MKKILNKKTILFFTLNTFFSSLCFSQQRTGGMTNILRADTTYFQSSYITDGTTRPSYTTLYPSIELNTKQNGVNITVEHMMGRKNLTRSTWLQVQISDGVRTELVPIIKLEDAIIDNPDSYKSVVNFQLSFKKLNEALKQVAPHAQISIGKGTPLYVQSLYHEFEHVWGGPARGGLIIVPGESKSESTSARPTDLDLAFKISANMVRQYNSDNGKVGLKLGGQVRSRLEGEGKYQIPEFDYLRLRSKLFELANSPNQVKQLLGDDWELTLENRYMQKDEMGQLKLDQHGLPIPDPMVDTYYDNDTLDAAKKDIALRYRWTEGNRAGAWNFKPGIGIVTDSGVVYRIEYGIDTTDNKPESLEKFASSDHVLNPFKVLKKMFPNKNISEFMKPSVQLTDYRYKFKLKHKTGLIVEMSLDDVRSENLRKKGRIGRYYQLEMDIDHLSTVSNKVQTLGNAVELKEIDHIKDWLVSLSDSAKFVGSIKMHDVQDLESSSPIMNNEKNKIDFSTATKAIVKLRDQIIVHWAPGAQKYAMAVKALGLLKYSDTSASVKAAHQGLSQIYLQRSLSKQIRCENLF